MARIHRFNLVNNICSPGLNTKCQPTIDLKVIEYKLPLDE